MNLGVSIDFVIAEFLQGVRRKHADEGQTCRAFRPDYPLIPDPPFINARGPTMSTHVIIQQLCKPDTWRQRFITMVARFIH